MKILIPVAIILVILQILTVLAKKQKNNKNSIDKFDYTNSYQVRKFLSENEKQAYVKLKELTEENGLLLFAKVRLFDLIEPKTNTQNKQGAQWKIQAKHVDFVICDSVLEVKAIIELDDNSHNRADRKERDNFVDTVLKNNGYNIIHVRTINRDEIVPILSGYNGYNLHNM